MIGIQDGKGTGLERNTIRCKKYFTMIKLRAHSVSLIKGRDGHET